MSEQRSLSITLRHFGFARERAKKPAVTQRATRSVEDLGVEKDRPPDVLF
jgi:hypothetical protein